MKSGHRLDIIGMALEHLYQKSLEKLGMKFVLLIIIF